MYVVLLCNFQVNAVIYSVAKSSRHILTVNIEKSEETHIVAPYTIINYTN